MSVPSYKAVLKAYNSAPQGIRDYFKDLLCLVNKNTRLWEVALAYMFMRVEKSQNMLLYCGVVKVHRADSNFAWCVMNKQHLTHEVSLKLFENIFGKAVKSDIQSHLEAAQKLRNKVVHGKDVSDKEIREAIVHILTYAQRLNVFVDDIAKFKPFSALRGFKGRGKSLDKKTTRWLMKGMEFAVQ